jgi:hypothetical protein
MHMCYLRAVAFTARSKRTNTRTVVLLRESEALERANASVVRTCNNLDELRMQLSERAIP